MQDDKNFKNNMCDEKFNDFKDEIEALVAIYDNLQCDTFSSECLLSGQIEIIPKCDGINMKIADCSFQLKFFPPIKTKYVVTKFPFDVKLELFTSWIDCSSLMRLHNKLNGFLKSASPLYNCLTFLENDCLQFLYGQDGGIVLDEKDEKSPEMADCLLKFNTDERKRRFCNAIVECCSCLVHKKGNQCVQLERCEHVFCRECADAFFKTCVARGELDLKCLFCGQSLDYQELKDVLDPATFVRLDQLRIDRYMKLNSVPCPLCHTSVLKENGKLAICPRCNSGFCTFCKKKYHGENLCPDIIVARQAQIEEALKKVDNCNLPVVRQYLKENAERFEYDTQILFETIRRICDRETSINSFLSGFTIENKMEARQAIQAEKRAPDYNIEDLEQIFLNAERHHMVDQFAKLQPDDIQEYTSNLLMGEMRDQSLEHVEELMKSRLSEIKAVRLKLHEEDKKGQELVKRDFRQCPSCGEAFQKTSGCNKMSCATCGVFFCYFCNTPIENYSHFGVYPKKCPLTGVLVNNQLVNDEV